jgi:hypothetical protein
MSIKTKEVDITFPTEVLVWAAKNNLNLYCPVGKEDEILYQEAYWASELRNSTDIDLERGTCGFAFDENDEDCLEQPSHYTTLELPETATEYQLLLEKELFERHISDLMKSGCDEKEARRIAISHVTGLPSTVEHINFEQRWM